MKVLIRALTLSTLLLAGTTAYYGQALVRERARTDTRMALSHETLPARDIRQSATNGLPRVDDSALLPTTTTPAERPRYGPQECPDPDVLAAARQTWQRHNDPAEQPALKIETRQSLSRFWAPIAAAMQMPDTELQHFLDQMLDESFRIARREAECMASIDCLCNSRPVMEPLAEERRQLIKATLGPIWMPGYETYVYANHERVHLREMRSKLKEEDQLDEEKTNRFALALAEVRRAFIAEAAAEGQRIRISSAGFAVHDVDGDQPPPLLDPPNWNLTDRFNQRLDAVAVRHLTSPQLKAFRALRKERLDLARAVTR